MTANQITKFFVVKTDYLLKQFAYDRIPVEYAALVNSTAVQSIFQVGF